jgi:hypothetical protein
MLLKNISALLALYEKEKGPWRTLFLDQGDIRALRKIYNIFLKNNNDPNRELTQQEIADLKEQVIDPAKTQEGKLSHTIFTRLKFQVALTEVDAAMAARSEQKHGIDTRHQPSDASSNTPQETQAFYLSYQQKIRNIVSKELATVLRTERSKIESNTPINKEDALSYQSTIKDIIHNSSEKKPIPEALWNNHLKRRVAAALWCDPQVKKHFKNLNNDNFYKMVDMVRDEDISHLSLNTFLFPPYIFESLDQRTFSNKK